MLGALKPHSKQDIDTQKLYQQAHCSTCKAVQDLSWTAPLSLSHEASFLSLLAILSSKQTLTAQKSRCSAFPLLQKSTLLLPKAVKEIVSAFSIVASAAKLEDHRKDKEHLLLRVLVFPSVEPHLEWALNRLGISKRQFDCASEPIVKKTTSSDKLDNKDIQITLIDYLDLHHQSVGLIWYKSIFWIMNENEQKIDHNIIEKMSHSLCDLMIIKDAIEDGESDKKKGLFNPLFNLSETEQNRALVRAQREVIKSLSKLYEQSEKKVQQDLAYQALIDCVCSHVEAFRYQADFSYQNTIKNKLVNMAN